MNQKINKIFILCCCFLLTACQLREDQQYLTFIEDETVEYNEKFNACSLVVSADGYDQDTFTYNDESIELPNGKTIMCNMENKKPSLDTVKYTFHYRNQEQIKRIKFIDTTPPKIELKKEYEVQVDNEYFDLQKLITVQDNYDDDIILSFNGSYDISKAGTYEIEIIAEDSNKNQSKAKTKIIVIDSDNSNSGSYSQNNNQEQSNNSNPYSDNTDSGSSGSASYPSEKKESKLFLLDEYSTFDKCLNACNEYISGSNAMCIPYPENEQIKTGYLAIFQ